MPNTIRFLGLFISLLCSTFLYSQPTERLPTSWSETKENKSGNIIVHWNTVKPYVYKNSKGELIGIEVDLIKGFQDYLYAQHGIKIEITWKQLETFTQVYKAVQNTKGPGEFGISSLSILESRKQEISFSRPYLKDISVLVSNNEVQIASSGADFVKTFTTFQAVTLENSTYERNLLKLKKTAPSFF